MREDLEKSMVKILNQYADSYKYYSETERERRKTNLECYNFIKTVVYPYERVKYYRLYHNLRK